MGASKKWKNARRYHVYRAINVVLFIVLFGFACYASDIPDTLFKQTYSITEYIEETPFPTLADFSIDDTYSLVDEEGSFVEVWYDALSPVNIKWVEEASITLSDGSVTGGTLTVQYHVFIHEALAKQAATEYMGKTYVDREITSWHDDVDYVEFYSYFGLGKGLVMRMGNKVYNVMFFRDSLELKNLDREEYIDLILEYLG